MLGLNKKKFKFANTTSSKVVPIDCLSDQALDFAEESRNSKDDLQSTLLENSYSTGVTNTSKFDILPTIRILNASGNNNKSVSSDSNSVQMVENLAKNSVSSGIVKSQNDETGTNSKSCQSFCKYILFLFPHN